MARQITAWSFSRYRDYGACPFYAKCKYVDRLKEPDSPAMARGSGLHKSAEEFLTDQIPFIPTEFKNYEQSFQVLKTLTPSCELMFAFDSSWRPVKWDDWKNAWCRIKVDAMVVKEDIGFVVDFKTGQVKDEHDEQVDLYAMGLFLNYPEVEVVDSELWYLDHPIDKMKTFRFEARDVHELCGSWEARVRPMMTDTRFPPTPSNKCRYCHFRKENGGPCRY